jgi:hypothetical protein
VSGPLSDYPWHLEPDRSVQALQRAVLRRHYRGGRFGSVRVEVGEVTWLVAGYAVVSSVAGRVQWAWVPDRGDGLELVRAGLEGHLARVEFAAGHRRDPGVELDRATVRGEFGAGALLLVSAGGAPPVAEPGS